MSDLGRAMRVYVWLLVAIGVIVGLALGCGGLWLIQWLMAHISVR